MNSEVCGNPLCNVLEDAAEPAQMLRNELGSALMRASSLIGDEFYSHSDERLGEVMDIMLDRHSGQARYDVLAFGGFNGMDDRLFAVPWEAFARDLEQRRVVVDKVRSACAPGVDEGNGLGSVDPTRGDDSHC